MEIFDENTYDVLQKEYQKALSNSVKGVIDRALNKQIPFRCEKVEKVEKEDNLPRCAFLNNELIKILNGHKGQRAQTMLQLLYSNKNALPDCDKGESVVINKYENPLIKICSLLCEELEKIKSIDCALLIRSYSALAIACLI